MVWKRDNNTCQRCGMVSLYSPRKGPGKRTGEKVVCIVDLPGIIKEDVGPETIMVRFKGRRTEADYPGKKWLRLAQRLASKAEEGERIIPLSEWHSTNILRKYA